jgi:hypothetical protein
VGEGESVVKASGSKKKKDREDQMNYNDNAVKRDEMEVLTHTNKAKKRREKQKATTAAAENVRRRFYWWWRWRFSRCA